MSSDRTRQISTTFAKNLGTILGYDGNATRFMATCRAIYQADPGVRPGFPNADSYAGYILAVVHDRILLRADDIARFPMPSEEVAKAAREMSAAASAAVDPLTSRVFAASPAKQAAFGDEGTYRNYLHEKAREADDRGRR